MAKHFVNFLTFFTEMTGIELKGKLKEKGFTQEKAAIKLGVTRATLNNWCKQAELPLQVVKDVKTKLDIQVELTTLIGDDFIDVIKSQQETINRQSRIIEALTVK